MYVFMYARQKRCHFSDLSLFNHQIINGDSTSPGRITHLATAFSFISLPPEGLALVSHAGWTLSQFYLNCVGRRPNLVIKIFYRRNMWKFWNMFANTSLQVSLLLHEKGRVFDIHAGYATLKRNRMHNRILHSWSQ